MGGQKYSQIIMIGKYHLDAQGVMHMATCARSMKMFFSFKGLVKEGDPIEN
jgi:hypothetical protein